MRNLPDGRVEALFEGERQAVKLAIDFVRQGPPYARVARADVEYEAYTGEFARFELRYP